VVVSTRESKLRANRAVLNTIALGAEDLSTEWSPLGLNAGVTEALNQALLALDGRIADLRNLVGVVHVPLLAGEHEEEWQDIRRGLEVDESVADIALIIEVHTQIEEVVLAARHLIKHALEIKGLKLVGNVTQHNGGTEILLGQDVVRYDLVVGAIIGEVETHMERLVVQRNSTISQRTTNGVNMRSDDGGSLLEVRR
jgi:hypothetical protein